MLACLPLYPLSEIRPGKEGIWEDSSRGGTFQHASSPKGPADIRRGPRRGPQMYAAQMLYIYGGDPAGDQI